MGGGATLRTRVDLRSADLRSADLRSADLRSVLGLCFEALVCNNRAPVSAYSRMGFFSRSNFLDGMRTYFPIQSVALLS